MPIFYLEERMANNTTIKATIDIGAKINDF